MWEETRSQRKPTQTWEKVQTVAPAGNQLFFYQHYDKMTVEKKMLFEDLPSLGSTLFDTGPFWVRLEASTRRGKRERRNAH